ncbi:hypothetical protein P7C70_g7770, partial [Phenoliferia sp. Uapishka_3]
MSTDTSAQTSADYTSTVTAGATLMQKRIVVHHTASVITTAQKAAVHGVAVFGDPDRSPKGIAAIENLQNTWPINNPSVEAVGATTSTGTNVFSACVSGDEFCLPTSSVSTPSAYSSNGDVTKAASFLAGLVAAA